MFFTLLKVFKEKAEFFMTAETGPISMQMRCSALESAMEKEPRDKAIITGKAEEEGVMSLILINKNRKFVLEAFRYFLKSIDKDLFFLSHLTLELTYRDGKLVGVKESETEDNVYSLIYAEILEDSPSKIQFIKDSLRRILNRLEYINKDYAQILSKIFSIQNELEADNREVCRELKNFLHWICEDNFIFLGYQSYDYDLRLQEDSLLGICSLDEFLTEDKLLKGRLEAFLADSKAVLDFKRRPDLTTFVSKDGRISYIAIKCADVIHCIAGVLTSIAHRKPIQEIPYLNGKVAAVLEMSSSHMRSGSHDERLLKRTLEYYPREEIFEAKVEELRDSALRLMHVEVMSRCKIFVRYDPIGDFIYCIVALPQSIYSRKIFLQVQSFLAEVFNGRVLVSSVEIFENQMALAYISLQGKSGIKKASLKELESKIGDIIMDWNNLFLRELRAKYGNRAREIHGKYLPELGYKNSFTPAEALADIEFALLDQEDVKFYEKKDGVHSNLRMHMYLKQQRLNLNKAVDCLGQIGLQVLKEDFYKLGPEDNPSFFVHVFRVQIEQTPKSIAKLFPFLEEALRNILSNKSRKMKALNKLVLQAQISWRQLSLIKTYTAYLGQISYPLGVDVIGQVLGKNGRITRMLLELFDARFNPSLKRAKEKEILRKVLQAIVPIADPLHDRILRAFVSLVTATTRTNFYCEGSRCLILKFFSKEIPFCPNPRPYVEAFVFSEYVEGCHLRDSIVSRGGIRWSDRKEDYRYEVLELQKTQTMKNSLIIPSGAKGAFYSTGILGVSASQTGSEAYRIFISSLLEITDNLDRKGKVVHPKNVVVHDRDDFYLAVAPDKGTATFSDLANQISEKKGFWMGDAFASGGSNGYDHKAIGITAKGAWISVMHHAAKKNFPESGHFTAVGCGDMSGDVFGNGMLQDKRMKLIAAFDYRDIFLDPDPDPKISWKERKRLFNLVGSSWQDYNKGLISKGGGVFSRKIKSIPVTPEICKALSIGSKVKECSPQELIQFILKAKVTLLWFGGIGTYVKSSGENQEDVKDNANMSVRINGNDLRCTIVGEGANLAMTQRGRVEASTCGVLLNTDFIDNSGGVSCSDQEVNLKILLDRLGKKMSKDERSRALEGFQDSVVERVLTSNTRQNFAISMDEALYKQDMVSVLNLISLQGIDLRKSGMLRPSELQIRNITRPEICSMFSHIKNAFKKAMYKDNVVEGLPKGFLYQYALSHFPAATRKHEANIKAHPLYERICITSVVNNIVDFGGISFISYLNNEEDKSRILKAFVITDKLFEIERIWLSVEEERGLDWEEKKRMFLKIRNLLCVSMDYFLYCMEDLDLALGKLDLYKTNLNSLLKRHRGIFKGKASITSDSSLAARLDVVTSMRDHINLIEVGDPDNLIRFAKAYGSMFREIHMDWFMQHIHSVNGVDDWEIMLIDALKKKLVQALRSLVVCMLKCGGKDYKAFFSSQLNKKPARIFSKNMRLLRESKAINLEQVSVIVLDFERMVSLIRKDCSFSMSDPL